MEPARRLSLGTVDLFTLVGGLSLVAMMLHIVADVASKHLLGAPVPATLETVSYYYMAGVAFLPLAGLERHGSLIHVELVYDLMPGAVRWTMLAIAYALAAVYCAAAAWAALGPALEGWAIGTYSVGLVRLATWPPRFLPVAGFALLSAVLAVKLAVHVAGPFRRSRSSTAPGRDGA